MNRDEFLSTVTVASLVLGAAALLPQCLHPAEDRAARDAKVGRLERGGLRVEVGDGLAAIRTLDDGHLTLWSSAPALELRLTTTPAPHSVALLAQNCLPSAELVVIEGEASVTPEPRELPTECAYRLELRTPEVRLRLAEPTPPSTAFRFAVLSDVQEAIDRVDDVYRTINAQPEVSFVLGAGDLTEQGTVEQLEEFQEKLAGLALPYYSTLGNHELGVSPPLFHDFFGRGNLSFVYRDARFTLLDSASATIDARVYGWLDGWLARGREQVHVVAMHIPPLDPIGVRNGAFANRNEAADLLGRLARGRVDLTLYGHIHSYYRFNNAGIDAHISGGGGAIPEEFDGIGRHFLVVQVDGGAVRGVELVRVDR